MELLEFLGMMQNTALNMAVMFIFMAGALSVGARLLEILAEIIGALLGAWDREAKRKLDDREL